MADEKAVQKTEGTVSERFTKAVMREFGSISGEVMALTPYQKRLAQHLFLRIDSALKELEEKRIDRGGQGSPIVWANVNMQKLATDTMYRIELGLDALIPNHISPIPYFNKRLGKYDLDLRIGYAGKDFYKRETALERPKEIIYELIYDTDIFKPIKKSVKNPLESYEFEIVNPFKRGTVIGGFGYIVYDDPRKNMLVLVTEDDFLKSMGKAKSKDFWTNYPTEMRMKTLVIRTTDKLKVDPEKTTRAFMAVERDDAEDAIRVKQEIEENANTGPVIEISTEDMEPGEEMPSPEPETPEPPAEEPKQAQTTRKPDF